MRKSMQSFIEICLDIKMHLQVASFELHHYEDGDFADFKVKTISDPRGLCLVANGLCLKIFAEDGQIVIRIFENFSEY